MLTDLIARAWEQERAKYLILNGHHDPEARLWLTKELTQGDAGPILADTEEACQAHLDRLCAAAVEKALADAGLVVVEQSDLKELIGTSRMSGDYAKAFDSGVRCVIRHIEGRRPIQLVGS